MTTGPTIEEALAENLASWDERARLHVASYVAESFADDPDRIESVVAASLFEA
jgi:hypothetical protein